MITHGINGVEGIIILSRSLQKHFRSRLHNRITSTTFILCETYRRRRPPSVSQDYGFAPGIIEQHLWWLKRLIFEWQSLSHLSHLKIVLGSVTVPMAFLIFLFSTCRMFRVCSACLIPSFTRCCHVEWSLTISSQLSVSMAADFISLLQTSLRRRSGQPVLCVPLSSSP